MSITRDEIARLCAEHDRFLAECASEQTVRALVRKSDNPAGLVFRTTESAPAPAATAAAEPSAAPFDVQQLEDALVELVVLERKLTRSERDAAIAPLTVEIAELRGKLDAVLTILSGDKSKSAVIDVPNWRRRDVA